jgi:hypothetical protein
LPALPRDQAEAAESSEESDGAEKIPPPPVVYPAVEREVAEEADTLMPPGLPASLDERPSAGR